MAEEFQVNIGITCVRQKIIDTTFKLIFKDNSNRYSGIAMY